ncbi:MAG: PilZ domain-containing protein [Bacillota bacterium]|nr:PilZ domain-containing protein [Bacillota bacterium]
MQEKRRQIRYPANIRLTIESLYKQDNQRIDSINEDIEIVNISRSGIGFTCAEDMPLDYYFNAKIEIIGDKHFYTVVKLIRKDERENGFYYGSEFVGLADVLSIFVEEYGQSLTEHE